MITFNTSQDKIDSYLSGTMSEQEEKEFMQECYENSMVRNQLHMTGLLFKLLQ